MPPNDNKDKSVTMFFYRNPDYSNAMLEALYIVSPGGIPIYFKNLATAEGRDSVEAVTLFSGLISAIQRFLVETNVGELSFFTTSTHEIYIEATDTFAAVAVCGHCETGMSGNIREFIKEIIGAVSHLKSDFCEGNQITAATYDSLDVLVSNTYSRWIQHTKESEATQKLKESLW